MGTKEVGNLGEKIAERYLQAKGYQILDKNYSFRVPGSPQKGEIDLVSERNGIISFIEVKTSMFKFGGGPASFISPEERVNFSKQRKLVKTAESWLMKKKIPFDRQWQIDVIAINIDASSDKAKIDHFENAIC